MTPPDWGQGHLSPEAVVAYVDGELATGPHARATQHLGQCRECAGQVSMQGQTRKALRTADGPCMPSALLNNLRAIPQVADLPGPPPGLAVGADGVLVSVLRPEPAGFPVGVQASPHDESRDSRSRTNHRRLRIGTGIAASGFAVGALLLVASGGPTPAQPSTAGPSAVLGGLSTPSPNGLDAQLRLTGAPAPAAPVVER